MPESKPKHERACLLSSICISSCPLKTVTGWRTQVSLFCRKQLNGKPNIVRMPFYNAKFEENKN